MLKHIREAIRRSGVPPPEVVQGSYNGHVLLSVKGQKIICSSSPRNPVIATKKIANDIARAWGA